MSISLHPTSARPQRLTTAAVSALVVLVVLTGPTAIAQEGSPGATEAPLFGTLFEVPDMITEEDSTSLSGVEYTGRAETQLYDNRIDAYGTHNAYIYTVTFDDGLSMKVQVNPEFGSQEAARVQVERHTRALGQMPAVLREIVDVVTIHDGNGSYGGGGNGILIHTDQTTMYEEVGTLEEVLIHEAAHSLDPAEAHTEGWNRAMQSDGIALSDYAQENPNREDFAETLVIYLAQRYRPARLPEKVQNAVELVPARLAYLDDRNFTAYPMTDDAPAQAPDGDEPPNDDEASLDEEVWWDEAGQQGETPPVAPSDPPPRVSSLSAQMWVTPLAQSSTKKDLRS